MGREKIRRERKMVDKLLVAPCSYEATKFACENFHYAQRIPSSKLVKHGVWEDGKFIGAIVYGDSSNPNMCSPYNLKYTEVCELRRVALTTHKHPVTQILSKSLKLLHKTNPNLKLVISYADKNEDHLGIIYQANNWIFEKETEDRMVLIVINGEKIHPRSVYDRYGTSSLEWIKENIDPYAYGIKKKGKFKYLYPLTKSAKKMFINRSKPYPKKIE